MIRKIIEIIVKNKNNKLNILKDTEALLNEEEFDNIQELCQTLLFGRFLKKVGEIIEDKLKDDVLEYVKENERFENEDGMISLVSSDQYTYLDDKMLETYEKEYEETNEKLKRLRKSIKNRQETLVQEGLALKDTPNETIRINI